MNAEDVVFSRARRKSNGRTTWATPYHPNHPRVKRQEIKR